MEDTGSVIIHKSVDSGVVQNDGEVEKAEIVKSSLIDYQQESKSLS